MEAAVIDKIGALIAESKPTVKISDKDLKDGSMLYMHSNFKRVQRSRPGEIVFSDLTSFGTYLKEIDLAGCLVVIESPTKVQLFRNIDDETRDLEAVAYFESKSFSFDSYKPMDEFRIQLITMFEETDDQKKLLDYSAKITAKTEISYEDDNVTTNIVVKESTSGAIAETKTFSSIVELAPRRAFPEIEQPVAKFLFRVKKDNEKVSAALYDMSDASWKLEAAEGIRIFLADGKAGIGKIIM